MLQDNKMYFNGSLSPDLWPECYVNKNKQKNISGKYILQL